MLYLSVNAKFQSINYLDKSVFNKSFLYLFMSSEVQYNDDISAMRGPSYQIGRLKLQQTYFLSLNIQVFCLCSGFCEDIATFPLSEVTWSYKVGVREPFVICIREGSNRPI